MVFDLGAGGRRIAPHVKTVDFADTGENDYVCSVEEIPVDSASADLVVATGLLEHVEDDLPVIREINRLLKTGGRVHLEVPFMQQQHRDPIDCRRYTVEGLELLLRRNGFEPEQSGFHIGPSVTIATLNAYYAAMLFEGDNPVSKALSNGAFLVMSVIGWPFKFLDHLLKNKKSAHRLAFGVYCTARKVAEA